jgi:hypothetical protein
MTRPERIRRVVQLLLAAAIATAAGCNGGPTVAAGPDDRRTALPDPNEDAALSMLLLESAEPNTVAPVKGDGSLPAPSQLPRPDTLIVDQPAALTTDPNSNWRVLKFENADAVDGYPRRRAMPSRLLQKMEQMAKARKDVEFVVSGETTLYRGHAYLLLRRAASFMPREPDKTPAPEPSKPDPNAADANAPADPNTTTQPASPEDIMQELLKHKPDRPVRLPEVDSTEHEEEPVAPRRIKPGRDAQSIVQNRVVYFVPEKDSDWWQARFVSDNALTDRPARLLPNRLRERAEELARTQAGRGQLFTVSGEITHYRGRRYLLIRKLFVKRDMGQF